MMRKIASVRVLVGDVSEEIIKQKLKDCGMNISECANQLFDDMTMMDLCASSIPSSHPPPPPPSSAFSSASSSPSAAKMRAAKGPTNKKDTKRSRPRGKAVPNEEDAALRERPLKQVKGEGIAASSTGEGSASAADLTTAVSSFPPSQTSAPAGPSRWQSPPMKPSHLSSLPPSSAAVSSSPDTQDPPSMTSSPHPSIPTAKNSNSTYSNGIQVSPPTLQRISSEDVIDAIASDPFDGFKFCTGKKVELSEDSMVKGQFLIDQVNDEMDKEQQPDDDTITLPVEILPSSPLRKVFSPSQQRGSQDTGPALGISRSQRRTASPSSSTSGRMSSRSPRSTPSSQSQPTSVPASPAFDKSGCDITRETSKGTGTASPLVPTAQAMESRLLCGSNSRRSISSDCTDSNDCGATAETAPKTIVRRLGLGLRRRASTTISVSTPYALASSKPFLPKALDSAPVSLPSAWNGNRFSSASASASVSSTGAPAICGSVAPCPPSSPGQDDGAASAPSRPSRQNAYVDATMDLSSMPPLDLPTGLSQDSPLNRLDTGTHPRKESIPSPVGSSSTSAVMNVGVGVGVTPSQKELIEQKRQAALLLRQAKLEEQRAAIMVTSSSSTLSSSSSVSSLPRAIAAHALALDKVLTIFGEEETNTEDETSAEYRANMDETNKLVEEMAAQKKAMFEKRRQQTKKQQQHTPASVHTPAPTVRLLPPTTSTIPLSGPTISSNTAITTARSCSSDRALSLQLDEDSAAVRALLEREILLAHASATALRRTVRTGIRDEEMKTAFNFEKAHKWRTVAQQMLSDMLEKYRISHAERQFTMSSLLQALNVDKAQVRWSDIEDAFF